MNLGPADRCGPGLWIDGGLRLEGRLPAGVSFLLGAREALRDLPLLIWRFMYQEPGTESYSYRHHCG
jgi:hypothetical protein